MTDATDTTAADKAAEAARKKAEKEAAAAEKKAAAEAKKAEKAAAKAEADAKKEADKAAAAAKKEADAAAKKAAAEANRMPEQNGVRRPKADTKCGRAWAIFDEVSKANGSPASIGEAMERAKADGQNESNVRAEYARWRKFHGITGRIAAPKADAPEAAAS